MEKVWLVTGCSTGFGRYLCIELLKVGEKVAVTSRNPKDIEDILAINPSNALGLALDVTDNAASLKAVNETLHHFGKIDVLVNNAGIGYLGSIEESDEKEVRRMFEINFFGLANMTTLVLPQMRKQRSGFIINISSIGGIISFPGVGYYNATKYAVDGFSESLSKEVSHLGIKVIIVAPSGFRTDWAGRSANESSMLIEDYETTAHQNQKNIRNASGKQPGNPIKAALAIIQAVNNPNPPLRLLLGAAALKNARKKIEDLQTDFTAWEETSVNADEPLN